MAGDVMSHSSVPPMTPLSTSLVSRPALALLLSLSACESQVVVEGTGGASNGTGVTPGTTSSWTTLGPECTSHDDCPPGGFCHLSAGLCTQRCDPNGCDACGPGFQCSSLEPCQDELPECYEPVPACVGFIADPGLVCDDDDPCPAGTTCLYHPKYGQPRCRPICGPDGSCPEGLTCDPCGQGTCCGCKDCVPTCLAPDDV